MFRNISLKSGFFPVTPKALSYFSERFLDSLPEIDLLGSWVAGEAIFRDWLSSAEVTPKHNLSPFHATTPWTENLAGLDVLVVHPFRDTILEQWRHREKLFSNKSFLPDFNLRVVKADQTRGVDSGDLEPWSDRLKRMADEALSARFDLAILGCGSYGLPLGALLKRDGKKVFHLGGETQALFGISGKRWDKLGIYNEFWKNPAPHERPQNRSGLGSSPYW